MTLVAFEGVHKRYRTGYAEAVVLDDASFTVDAGEYIGIWGRRRAGKSTVLNLCAGLELPDAGRVLFDGVDTRELSSKDRTRLLRNDIGYASTSFAHEKADTTRTERVADYLSVPLVGRGLKPLEARAAARAALNDVGALDHIDASLHELGLGDRTLVAIARALIRQPRLLLIDEPEVCPEPEEREAIRRLVRKLGRTPELTVIVASGSPGAVKGAQRVLSVGHGRILSQEQLADVIPLQRGQEPREEAGSG